MLKNLIELYFEKNNNAYYEIQTRFLIEIRLLNKISFVIWW